MLPMPPNETKVLPVVDSAGARKRASAEPGAWLYQISLQRDLRGSAFEE